MRNYYLHLPYTVDVYMPNSHYRVYYVVVYNKRQVKYTVLSIADFFHAICDDNFSNTMIMIIATVVALMMIMIKTIKI